MKISVVIRALNEEQHIGRLLTGLSRQTVVPHEVVVVDSGSTDATVAIAERFPDVRTVTIDPTQFSFGRALNIGCSHARGDLVVIASAHVYPVYDTWIEELTRPFGDPLVALAYGRQQGDERTQFSEWQVLRKWFPDRSTTRQDHPFCNNANAAIRRSVWEQLPYDEELTGLEDLDWARRTQSAGFHVAYSAEAVVVHVHEESWRQTVNRYRREAMAHRRIYPEQRLRLVEAAGLAIGNTCGDVGRAARDGVLRGNVRGIVRFRSAQFAGSYLGFRNRGAVNESLKRRFYYPSKPRYWSEPVNPRGATPIDYSSGTAHEDRE